MIEWGKTQNPKKPLDQNLTPKKSLAEFPSHNSFQKAETVEKQVWFYTLLAELTRRAYAGTLTNLHILQIKLPRKLLAKIFLPKKSQYQKFQTQKNLSIIPVT